jgi:hypothetical protein
MKDLTLSVYDFFAYLASGFVLLWFVSYAFDLPWFAGAGPSGVLLQWIIGSYVIGHVIAHLSSAMIEATVVRRWLGRNESTLFGDVTGWRSRYFPGFFKALPASTQQRVLARATTNGITEPGEGLFYHCFGVVKNDATAFGRMNTFLNLYGFARNISMACLLGIAVLAVGALRPFLRGGAPSYEKQWMILPALVVAIVMFYRYLKFYRHYSLELYVTFAAQQG